MNDNIPKPKRSHKNSGFYSSQIGVKSSKPQTKTLLMTFIPKETPSIFSQTTNAETYLEGDNNKSSNGGSSSSSRKSSSSSSSPSNSSDNQRNSNAKITKAPSNFKNNSVEINLLEENYDEIVNVILHSKKKPSANDVVLNNNSTIIEQELTKDSSSSGCGSTKAKTTNFERRGYIRQQSISPIDIINQHDDEVKGMTNTQEISNFYDYTKSCMKMILTISTIEYTHPAKVSFPFVKETNCGGAYKKLAVFDLDETLVHCLTKDFENEENIIEVPLPSKKTAKIAVLVRPHWKEAIRRIQKKYQLVIYTASHQSYADAVLNFLDPENKYFPFRLYRNNCIMVKNNTQIIYVKDCSIFNDFDLKDVVLVDNSVLSFAYHLENGIPILPYYDAKVDFELLFCACYLESICEYADLRDGNKKLLKLDQFLCQAIEELEEEKKEKRYKKKKSKNSEHDLPLPQLQSQSQSQSNQQTQQPEKEKEKEKEKRKKKHKEKHKVKSIKEENKKKLSNFCLDFKYDLQELRNKFNVKEDKD